MSSMVKPITYGRMGNFLFQAATALAYAWKNGIDYTLPSETKDPKWNPIYLQHLVNKNWNPRLPVVAIEENGHLYQELPFDPRWKGERNVTLNGYWQTEKYFKAYRENILEAFGFQYYTHLKGVVSVHVRRGDYLRIKRDGVFKHPTVSKEWILEQMAKFPDHRFIFFSDDIPWCIQEFGRDHSFSEGRSETIDLEIMSSCEHHICSASTFSWWGAWLNQNPQKRVIMPKYWFHPGWDKLDTSDIVPLSWERV